MQHIGFPDHGRPLMLALAALVVMGGVGPAARQAAEVRGRVDIGIPITIRRPTAAYPSRSVPAPALAPESERRHAVVYVRDAGRQDVTPMRVAIRQRNESFTPRVIAVTVGSEVEFPNDDPIYHNVFSRARRTPRAAWIRAAWLRSSGRRVRGLVETWI